MAPEWPTDPNDPVDPALAPLIEAGEGEQEGFEQADAALIGHARHDDLHGTEPIMRDAFGFPEEEDPGDAGIEYGEPDEEEPRDW